MFITFLLNSNFHIKDLPLEWKDGYYFTNIPFLNYRLPSGSNSEDVTIYVTYNSNDNYYQTKTVQQTFTLQKCPVGTTKNKQEAPENGADKQQQAP